MSAEAIQHLDKAHRNSQEAMTVEVQEETLVLEAEAQEAKPYFLKKQQRRLKKGLLFHAIPPHANTLANKQKM